MAVTTPNAASGRSLFPDEQRRLLRLIRDTGAEGVVFLSGDVHYGEISALQPGAPHAPPPAGGGAGAGTDLGSASAGAAGAGGSAGGNAGGGANGGADGEEDATAGASADDGDLADIAGYPIYDATSSGLTQADSWFFTPPNGNRVTGTNSVGGRGGNNWGRLTVDFDGDAVGGQRGPTSPVLRFEIFNEAGEVAAAADVALADLSLARPGNTADVEAPPEGGFVAVTDVEVAARGDTLSAGVK